MPFVASFVEAVCEASLIGETFAGRVAASLLTAIGVARIDRSDQEQYESMVIEPANGPDLLAAIKHKLAQKRLTKPLFDTTSYMWHIESAYATMYPRGQDGLAPDHIHVPQ